MRATEKKRVLPRVRIELTTFRLWDWRAAYCANEAADDNHSKVRKSCLVAIGPTDETTNGWLQLTRHHWRVIEKHSIDNWVFQSSLVNSYRWGAKIAETSQAVLIEWTLSTRCTWTFCILSAKMVLFNSSETVRNIFEVLNVCFGLAGQWIGIGLSGS